MKLSRRHAIAAMGAAATLAMPHLRRARADAGVVNGAIKTAARARNLSIRSAYKPNPGQVLARFMNCPRVAWQ